MSKLVPVIGALGSLPFVCAYGKVLTFHELNKEQSVRWARHEVIGKKPMLEFIGDDLMTVSLKIRFDTNLGVPPIIGLKHLQKQLDNKQAKSLVIGGEYFGRFVIESVSEERRFHTGAGVCTVAEATIKLIEHPGPRMSSWSRQVSRLSERMRGLFE